MAEGLRDRLHEEANGIGNRRKTTETETRSSLNTGYACTGRFPPKYEPPRMPANQIIALPARALCWCTRCRQLQLVYKASQIVSKPFGLGLARVRLR